MSRRKDRKRNRRSNRMSEHHFIPRSRGGKGTVRIHKSIHEKYHSLFGNMLPEEILQYLIEVFWGGYIPKQMRPSTFRRWEDDHSDSDDTSGI